MLQMSDSARALLESTYAHFEKIKGHEEFGKVLRQAYIEAAAGNLKKLRSLNSTFREMRFGLLSFEEGRRQVIAISWSV